MSLTSDTYTAADTSWTVPAGVHSVALEVTGAPGGNAGFTGIGGKGGRVYASFAVTAGDVLRMRVGAAGAYGIGPTAGAGGEGGDADGGDGQTGSGAGGGGGGGASYVLINGVLAAVAGGGGGASGAFHAAGGRGALAFGAGPLGAGTQAGSGSSGGGGGGYPGGVAVAGQGGPGGSPWVRGDATSAAIDTGDPSGYVTRIVVSYTVWALPLAPTPTGPPTGSTVVRSSVAPVWTPSSADGVTASEVRYRVVGAPSWTVQSISGSASTASLPTLTAGDYECQARSQNPGGDWGPWSVSWYFTAADQPAAPTITGPGSVVNPAGVITWSAPSQTDYAVQVLKADGSATIDVTATDSVARSLTVYEAFTENGTTMQIRVRIKLSGVWSPWAAVSRLVTWDGPAAPTVVLVPRPGDGALDVAVSNPVVAGRPAAVSNDVFVSVDGGTESRVARGVPVNGAWRWWLPPSTPAVVGVRVAAVSTLGTVTSSAVTT